jgi:hypothetical protein
MLDVAYVFGAVAFFAIMLAYVDGCARLGRTAADGDAER